MIVAVEYYRQIRKAQREYEKARDFVEDIVLSFNRELKRESDRIEAVSFKVEGSSSKADAGLSRINNVEKRIAPVEEQIGALSQTITQTLGQTSQSSSSLLSGLTGLEVKLKNIETAQETLRQ